MIRIKRLIIAAMAAVTFSAGAVPATASETPLKLVLEDAVYGGLIGTLLGAATLVFTSHKSDHLDNIAYGAGLGVIAGTGFGIYRNLDRSFVEYENGKVRLALPTVKPDLQENANGHMILAVKADLFRGNF